MPVLALSAIRHITGQEKDEMLGARNRRVCPAHGLLMFSSDRRHFCNGIDVLDAAARFGLSASRQEF
jgi:hypothetical protein